MEKRRQIENDAAEDKFNEIINSSAPPKFVLAEVQRVAPTDSTVPGCRTDGDGRGASTVVR
jgi:transcriptional regulator with GAF, ATPase, and Fis domain